MCFKNYLIKNPALMIQFECRKEFAKDILDPTEKNRDVPWLIRLGNKIYEIVTRKWDCGETEKMTFEEATQICQEEYSIPLTPIPDKANI